MFDPLKAYGERLSFDVLRNGKKVGFHEVSFSRNDDRLQVTAKFSLEIDFLMFNAYRYRYESKSMWRDGCLIALEARTDDNGETSSVKVGFDAGNLVINGPSGAATAEFPVFPTDHWHPGVLDQSRVLNTIKGRIDRVSIVEHGMEPVRTANGLRPARQYAYTGDLQTTVWYDEARRWVKMRFRAKDQSTIEYVCRQCGGPASEAS